VAGLDRDASGNAGVLGRVTEGGADGVARLCGRTDGRRKEWPLKRATWRW
jgi:hypothetical protein